MKLTLATRTLDLTSVEHKRDGHCVHITFSNGYGASVVDDGYGSEEGLYEIAVLGQDGGVTYDTPITSDVIGYMTPAEVYDVLASIAALPVGEVTAV